MIEIKSPSDLQDKILTADIGIVYFTAPWCAPCRQLAPTLEQLQAANPALVIGKVNVDENKELAKAAGLRSVPTLMLVRRGETKGMLVGNQPLQRLQEFIDTAKS